LIFCKVIIKTKGDFIMTVTGIEAIIEKWTEKVFERLQKENEKNSIQLIEKAIEVYNKNVSEKNKKLYLRNTKILLKHYSEFEAHINGAITCKKELLESHYMKELADKSLTEILSSNLDEDIYIASIQRTKSRTQLLLNNIDAQLLQLKKLCMKKCIIHKYQILIDYYINGYNMEGLAQKYAVHVSQISKWINEIVQVFSRLLFGIESIDEI